MFRKRYRQQIPELNTTSTADISFMLLIFFLVTSSMDTEKGLLRQMAPPPQQEEQLTDINKDCVLQVELDAHDQLTCNGIVMTPQQLAKEVKTMASVNREGHVVAVKADRHCVRVMPRGILASTMWHVIMRNGRLPTTIIPNASVKI